MAYEGGRMDTERRTQRDVVDVRQYSFVPYYFFYFDYICPKPLFGTFRFL